MNFHHYRNCPSYVSCSKESLYYDDDILKYMPELNKRLGLLPISLRGKGRWLNYLKNHNNFICNVYSSGKNSSAWCTKQSTFNLGPKGFAVRVMPSEFTSIVNYRCYSKQSTVSRLLDNGFYNSMSVSRKVSRASHLLYNLLFAFTQGRTRCSWDDFWKPRVGNI